MDFLSRIVGLKNSRSRYGNKSAYEDYITMAKGLLINNQANDLSDQEIERCCGSCIGAKFFVPFAKYLRDNKKL